MQGSRDFFAGLGALAYAISAADNDIEATEITSIGKSFLSEFGHATMSTYGSRAQANFETFAREKTDADTAFAKAMQLFNLDTKELKYFRPQIVSILDKIAKADREHCEKETELIARFKQETEAVLA